MTEPRLEGEGVRRFAALLWASRNCTDVLRAERTLGSADYGIRAMVSLPGLEYDHGLIPFVPHLALSQESIVPYFCYRYIYHVRHDRLALPALRPDYTVTFDSNFSGCVSRLVSGKSTSNLPSGFLPVVDALLRNDLNYDPTFYLIENAKQLQLSYDALKETQRSSPLEFWNSLDSGLRQNLVSSP